MGYDVTKIFQGAPMVKLGELIEECDLRNSDNTYTHGDVVGISTDKKFITTKANLEGVSLTSYKVVKPREFAYVADTSRRGDKIALALNTMEQSVLISSIYTSFRCKDENKLLPEYLYLLLIRTEFDRIARFNSWGSARETYMFSDLGRYEIPLPGIEVQREYVAAYRSLQQLAEQNEALAAPLQEACNAFLAKISTRYKKVALEDFLIEQTQNNSSNYYGIESARGVNTLKEIQLCKRLGESLNSYKIVNPGQIVFNANIKLTKTTEKFAVAMLKEDKPCIVSNFYVVFDIKNEFKQYLLPHFLFLFLIRDDFARYIKFTCCSSVRDRFSFADLCNVRIPLPPIEVQRSIVALYNCAEEARAIAKEAREQLKILAPAMVQRAANTPVEV